ncbi:hypothetical protein [Fodinicola acaciae]|uniref:hypothetical protein n=1 Tax=Fodinicola acaciae TaxID=2681555 RepID=UPI0013D396D2|nr:hypothetical protein [Fodinicola acaciae]
MTDDVSMGPLSEEIDLDLCLLGDALAGWYREVDAGELTTVGRLAVLSSLGEPLVDRVLTEWHVDRLAGYLVGEWAGLRLATPIVLVELLHRMVEPDADGEPTIGYLAIDDANTNSRHLLAVGPHGAEHLAEMLGVSAEIARVERAEATTGTLRPGMRVRVLTDIEGNGLGTVSRVRTTLRVGTPELFVYDVRLDDGHGELLRFTADRLELQQ